MSETTMAAEFPFVAEMPKREKSKYAKFKERYSAYKAFIDENGAVVTTGIASKLSGVGTQRIRDLIEDGRLKSCKFDGLLYVTEDTLVDFMASERKAGRPSKFMQDAEKKGAFRAAVSVVKEMMK
jgi:hypothetical protein